VNESARGSVEAGFGFAAHGYNLGFGLNINYIWTSVPSKNSGSLNS